MSARPIIAWMLIAIGGACNESSPLGEGRGLQIRVDALTLAEGRLDSLSLPLAAGAAAGPVEFIGRSWAKVDASISSGYLRVQGRAGWAGETEIIVRVTESDGRHSMTIAVPVRVNAGPYQVSRNPYAGVDWSSTKRWKVQLHDHLGTQPEAYRAYDAAGYHAVPVMDYSGVRSLPYTWRQRRWPAEAWLPSSLLRNFSSIRVLFPSAEEVGYRHLTSPFLETFIEKSESGLQDKSASWRYSSTQGAIDLIGRSGGAAFLAHPWSDFAAYSRLRRYAGVEIFSAFESYRREENRDRFFTMRDRQREMLRVWDDALMRDSRVVGIAVNDHFGPGNSDPTLSPRVRDSGKVFVLADTLTMESLRASLLGGRVLAVRDLGAVKERFPVVDSLWVDATGINLRASGIINWVVNGRTRGVGARMEFSSLPAGARYVRAEVYGLDGSAVYFQAIALELVGDVNGDGQVDERDDEVEATAPSRRANRRP